jgi:predicted nucleotidyltransferase
LASKLNTRAAGLAIAKSLRYGSASQIESFMKPSAALQVHRIAIRGVVARHHALNARVFGSVLRGDDKEGSDLDILIDPTPETSLMDVAAIQVELESLLGVKVDVLTPRALPEKFRSSVLAEAMPV